MAAPLPLAEAVAALRRQSDAVPRIALILGSGLGGLANRIEGAARVPYGSIPGFVPPTVAGHKGEVVLGRLGAADVVAFAGRFHMYEGHPAAQAAFPVRVAHALGAQTLLVSNAAGGIRRSFTPGTLMLIADHINLQWTNPLFGPVVTGDERFPDMSDPYDAALREEFRRVSRAEGIPLAEGVYAGLLGPTYETPAEVRMLAAMGADAVGMSTVAEVIVARAMGMRVGGVSCITNLAAGLSASPITHAEVIETTDRAAKSFEQLVIGVVKTIA